MATPDLVAGFDPGSHVVGWGVVDLEGETVAAGAWKLPSHRDVIGRLIALERLWREWAYRDRIAAAAIEKQFLSPRVRGDTAIVIGESRGWLEAFLVAAGVTDIRIVTPAEVKKALTGHGGADKRQMTARAEAAIDLSHVPEKIRDNAADAVAVARWRWQQKEVRQWTLAL